MLNNINLNNDHIKEIKTLNNEGKSYEKIAIAFRRRGILSPKGFRLTNLHISKLMIANGFRKMTRKVKGARVLNNQLSFNVDLKSPIAELNEIIKSNLSNDLKIKFVKEIAKAL